MKKSRLEILITNDDGYLAKGINVIAEFMKQWGNVTVVAPKTPQSGKSGSITLAVPLYLEEIRKEENLRIFTLTGTPVDCVKMGVRILRNEGRTVDLLVSGINHGSNTSAASVYSGTLGAATEGALYDIPSIGFSINTHDPDPDFEGVLRYAGIILDKYFETGLSRGTFLNVNVPDIPADEIKGIRIARQGAGRWVREFEAVTEADGSEHFAMMGMFEDMEPSYVSGGYIQGDHRLMQDGYVSVVPHRIDTTDYLEAERLCGLWECDTIL